MAYKVSQDKVNAIASAYCENGYKKVLALLSVGYSKNYANHTGLKLFGNVRVIEAIKAKQAELEAKSVYTKFKAEEEYDKAMTIAEGKHDASAMISAVTGKCKLYGFHVDVGINADIDVGRRPPDQARQASKKKIESYDI